MNTLSCAVLAVQSTSVSFMAASAVPGSACRFGPSDNGYIYSTCIAYVSIAAKVVKKQMLSIKQWESRIIIFDRWMRLTGLKRLPRSFMQIAFPTAWISASVRRLKVWKRRGKNSAHPTSHPHLPSANPTGQEMWQEGLSGCEEADHAMHQPSFTCRNRVTAQDTVQSARPFERGLMPSRDFPN